MSTVKKLGLVAFACLFANVGLALAEDAATTTAATSTTTTYSLITDRSIAANAGISYSKLNLADSIMTSDIKDEQIKHDNIGDGAINSNNINEGAITNKHLSDDFEFDLADGSVTTAKLADNAVTSPKIADGTIVNADISASAAIDGTKINPDFGSQDVTTTGNGYFANVDLTGNLMLDGGYIGDYGTSLLLGDGDDGIIINSSYLTDSSGYVDIGNYNDYSTVLSNDGVTYEDYYNNDISINGDTTVNDSLTVYGVMGNPGRQDTPTFQVLSSDPYGTDSDPLFEINPRGRTELRNYSGGSALWIGQMGNGNVLDTYSQAYGGTFAVGNSGSTYVNSYDQDVALNVNQNYSNGYDIAAFNGMYGQALSSRYNGTTVTGYDDGGSTAFTVNQSYVNGSATNVADFNSPNGNVVSMGYYGNTTLNSYDTGGSALTVNQSWNGYGNNIMSFNNSSGLLGYIDYDGNIVPADTNGNTLNDDHNLGADAAGSRWSTIYADTLNYAQTLTDSQNSGDGADVIMGMSESNGDTVTINADTQITDDEWQVSFDGDSVFNSVATGSAEINGGYAAGGANLNANGDIFTAGNIYATKSGDDVVMRLAEYQDSQSSPALNFQKGRGTEGAPSAVLDNDVLAYISGMGYDGSAMDYGAAIWMRAKSNWTGTDHASEIGFWTIPSGSTTQQQVLRLEEDGDVNVLAGNLIVGGGYGDSGLTIDTSGSLETDGNITLDGDLDANGNLNVNGDLISDGGNTVDFGAAASLEIPNGNSLPGSCSSGHLFQDTDSDDCSDTGGGDGALCICKGSTWTLISNF